MNQLILDRYNEEKLHIVENDSDYIGTVIVDDVPVDNYKFLFDPKYGWLDHFHSMYEWQYEFWKWMERKRYAQIIDNASKLVEDYVVKINVFGFVVKIQSLNTKLLIGYIKEFIEELI